MIRHICQVAVLTCLSFSSLAFGAAAADEIALARPGQMRVIHVAKLTSDLSTLKVVSWNIDRGTGFRQIASELTAQPADLLLLQEVDWNTRRTGKADVAVELAKCLGVNGVFGTEFEELGQEEGEKAFTGQATLSRLPIRASRLLVFEHQSSFWQPRSWLPSTVPLLQRREGQRIALITEFLFNGQLLVVYNAHLESRSYGRIQMQQIDEMLADTRRYAAGTSFLIGGDLNTKYLPSLYLKKLEGVGFHSCLGSRIERTHSIAMALDWIFAKGPIVMAGGAVRKDLKGSDHYPIYADLQAKLE